MQAEHIAVQEAGMVSVTAKPIFKCLNVIDYYSGL